MPYEVKKYQKVNFLAHKGGSNSGGMNICCFLFIRLLSFNFLRILKNETSLKIYLASVTFLMCILYRSSKLQHRLNFCFTCQFFTKDTVEITNEIDTSYFQNELNIFAISKFRFKNNDVGNGNDDINLNLGPFNNPQMFKQEGASF